MSKLRKLTKEDIGKTFVIDDEHNGVLKKVTQAGVYFKFENKQHTYGFSSQFKGLVGFAISGKFIEV